MNKKKLWIAAFSLLFGSIAVSAQEQRIKEEGKTEFKSHWFMQVQAGAAHTVGEAKFTDLISPAVALNVGYQFAPAWSARVGVSGWQAKGSWVAPRQDYKYKYLQGNVDIVSDLSTLFCGFNPKRVFNGYIFAGAGLNRGFDNDEAVAINAAGYPMGYLWTEGKFLVAGRLGLGCNLRLNDRLAINIEGNANVLSDKINSGALPFSMETTNYNTISPTLGNKPPPRAKETYRMSNTRKRPGVDCRSLSLPAISRRKHKSLPFNVPFSVRSVTLYLASFPTSSGNVPGVSTSTFKRFAPTCPTCPKRQNHTNNIRA